MSVGALQTYYSKEVYTSTPESVIALIGGLIAFVSPHQISASLGVERAEADAHALRSVTRDWQVSEVEQRIACEHQDLVDPYHPTLSVSMVSLLHNVI